MTTVQKIKQSIRNAKMTLVQTYYVGKKWIFGTHLQQSRQK